MKTRFLIFSAVVLLVVQGGFAQNAVLRPTPPPPRKPATDPVAWLKPHVEQLAMTTDPGKRLGLLLYVAQAALAAQQLEQAESFAKELIDLGETFGANYGFRPDGDAIFVGNTILGHLAIQRDDLQNAREYLLKVGDVSGSPALKTFGPGMSLAELLLEKGERDTVLKFFDQCSKFWEGDRGKLRQWKVLVAAGEMPDFGANRGYAVDTWRFEL